MPRNVKLKGVMDGRIVKAMDDGEDFGFIPVMLRLQTAANATNSVSLTMERKFTVVDAHAILIGADGTTSDTYQVFNGSNAITDVVSIASADDRDIVRAGEINDANMEIAAGGTLKVTATDGGSTDVPALYVYVLGYYSL
tara:strand:+ start:4052 stop:4471 length:420 start_codon:yes stop_codon:yes gene_type:complete